MIVQPVLEVAGDELPFPFTIPGQGVGALRDEVLERGKKKIGPALVGANLARRQVD